MVERNSGRVGAWPTKIASLATYVPPKVLTNADLERMVETSDDWIMQRVGIRERHIVDKGVATSDLGKEAALLAIEAKADYLQGFFFASPHSRLTEEVGGTALLDDLLHSGGPRLAA